jgi:LEA14-like dessication related protein
MMLQSKMIVYVAIAGVLAMMGGIVYYASLDNVDLAQVEIQLTSVDLIDINTIDNQASFNVTFLVKNPSDITLTVPLIAYQLYGNGILLGSGLYSTADIAMPGRAAFFPDTEIPLKNTFTLSKSEVSSEIYQAAIENRINSFSAEGIITAESSWSLIEKEFKTGF